MNRVAIDIDLSQYPEKLRSVLNGCGIYDSSCSPEARVIFVDKDKGYYLKSAPSGTLETEAEMTRYFCRKGLAAEVVEYISDQHSDWLLTERVEGEDCTYSEYIEAPKRLCDALAILLRELHETDGSDCPVQNRINSYLALADKNYREGRYDCSLFSGDWGFSGADEAWGILESNRHLLRADTLIHGDYCLPNIMLDDWRFSGYIDLGNGGIGDRHIDLFWGIWTLFFNLKTDKYTNRFLDAYGRDKVETEMLRVIAAAEVFG